MKNRLSPTLALCFFLVTIIFCSHQCLAEDTAPAAKNPDPSFSSVEERRIMTKIQDAQSSTNDDMKGLREKELKTLNEEADKKLGEINRKLEELQNLQKSLKAQLAKKNAEEVKRIKELGKIFEKMAPDKAALALSNMDDKLATDLLATMKPRSAAKILNVLDRKKASELSTTFSTIK
jgi:flagellar motility protein MotE (MotC chaperone)